MTFTRRRVVTRISDGAGVIESDGAPPNSVAAPTGFGVAEVLWLDGAARSVDDGGDRDSPGYPLEPPAGGLSSRIISMPASPDWLRVEGDEPDHPGLHTTDTLDLMVVLDGEITLGLPDAELVVRAGDAVIQRGTAHRWRVSGAGPCTYWVTMLRPDRARPAPAPLHLTGSGGNRRRIVTGGGGAADTRAPMGVDTPNVAITDLWQTNGPVTDPTQGGDVPGPWDLLPAGRGVCLRTVEMQPGPPSEAGWHATPTIDVDVVLTGRLRLELDGGHEAVLGPGDSVIQRGTNHRWSVVGDEPVTFAALMLGLEEGAP